MGIESVLIKKEEVPILHGTCFEIPIHPSLLNPANHISPRLANDLFEKAALEWYKDIQTYVLSISESENDEKGWIKEVFLSEKPGITASSGVQNFKGWEDNVLTDKNGFASGLSISRNYGGSLYFTKGDIECELHLSPNSRFVRFSPEKIRHYSIPDTLVSGRFKSYTYAKHNIDSFPGALFLRNWALLYLNEAVRHLDVQK